MGGLSITHWLIFLVVIVVIFGTSKLKNAGKDLGSAVKGFKDAVKEEDERDRLPMIESDNADATDIRIDIKDDHKV